MATSANSIKFGAILAVTPSNPPERMSWRKAGMQKAAEFSGLDIQYPTQPKWSDSDIERLTSNSNGELKKMPAMAWLGHLYTLKQASRYKTALIFEDDIDWDVSIREEAVKTAEAIWRLTQDPNVSGVNKEEPYGLAWDVLWLGHCGSSLPDDENIITTFHDPTVPPEIESNPDNKIRHVYRTGSPVCTFAYAVRQEVAVDIYERAAGQSIAFDVWLHFQCEGGHLKCFAVNPAIFNQHEMAGAHDSIINGQDHGFIVEQRVARDIWHSARCNAELGGTLDHPITCAA